MELIQHKNIPDDPESQFLSEFAQSSHPVVPETLRTVKAGSPIGALGQKVQVVEALVMVKLGQARIICLQGRLHRDKKRHDVGATRGHLHGCTKWRLLAPKGRNNEAQANGLGQQNLEQPSSPEGAEQSLQFHTYRSW